MNMIDLKNNWNKFLKRISKKPFYFYLSSTSLYQFEVLKKEYKKYLVGKCLDVGAGSLSIKSLAEKYCQEYKSQDIEKTHLELDFIGDLSRYKENDFDTVICNHVLEHTPEPEKLIKDIHEKLKSGGKLIITAPHMFYMHGLPHDYYRFTKQGLEYLLKKSGFKILKIYGFSSFFSVILSLFPTVIFSILGAIPILREILLIVNSLISIFFYQIEKRISFGGLLAMSFIAVAEK